MKHEHIDDTNERLAREFYIAYVTELHGNEVIPEEVFFEDLMYHRTANAYRAAVAAIVPPASYAMEADPREPVVIGADYEPPLQFASVHKTPVLLQRRTGDTGVEYRWSDAPDTIYASRAAAEERFNYAIDPDDSFFYAPPRTLLDDENDVAAFADPFDADLDEPLPPRTCGDGETCQSCQ